MTHPPPPNTPLVYGIVNCDSVKKARNWIAAHGLEHQFHDIKKQGLFESQLDHWLAQQPWDVLLNRKGTTWRKLDEPSRNQVVDATSAKALMLSQPSVIKRPVVSWPNGRITVGFDPEAFEQACTQP